MFLSLKTLYRKRTVIWPFYFYTIIRTLSLFRFYIKTDNFSIYLMIIFLICLGTASIIYNYKNNR
ncbi:hypothetical protein [Staphylococcus aureus]|uniref:hypothetical protein n=1 Tax=Staphylococcus aureus TaxID=1280 RepID=UPI003FA7E534